MTETFATRPPFKVNRVENLSDENGKPYRLFHCQSGFWEGPCEPGETGYYYLSKFTVDERFPNKSVSRNVSFWGELMKAMGN